MQGVCIAKLRSLSIIIDQNCSDVKKHLKKLRKEKSKDENEAEM